MSPSHGPITLVVVVGGIVVGPSVVGSAVVVVGHGSKGLVVFDTDLKLQVSLSQKKFSISSQVGIP